MDAGQAIKNKLKNLRSLFKILYKLSIFNFLQPDRPLIVNIYGNLKSYLKLSSLRFY